MARTVLAGLLIVFAAARAGAADRPQIFVLNAVIQGALTVVTSVVQGNVHGPGDIARRFASGSISGAGLYQAKVLTGKGHITSGWLLANAAGSLTENAVAGRHPFAQIGYSIGPLRVRFSIPRFDTRADAHAYVDVSAFQALAMLVAMSESDRAGLRAGMMVFRRDDPYDSFPDQEGGQAIGATAGIFPGVAEEAAYIWAHETIHAIQSLQGEVLEPSIPFLSRTLAPPGGPKRLLRFGSAKVGFVNFGNVLLYGTRDYEDEWMEIEAYQLADDQAPPLVGVLGR